MINWEMLETAEEKEQRRKDQLRQHVIAERDEKLDNAMRKVNLLETLIRAQEHDASEENTRDKRLLTAWREYLVALTQIEQQTGFPDQINWPDVPDESAIL